MRHAAIIVHYWVVTEMEQRALMDEGAVLAVITPSIECSVRGASHKMAARSANMAAIARSE